MPIQHTFEGEGDPNDLGLVAPEAGAHYVNLLNDALYLWDGDEWKLITSKDFKPTQSNILTKNPFGRWRVLEANETVVTVQAVMELNTEFVGLRIGIPNLAETAQAGIKLAIANTNSFMNDEAWYVHPYPNGGFWVNMTWNESGHGTDGGTAVTLPARLGPERPSVTYCDSIGIKSIPRLNPSTHPRPLLMVRIQYPAGTQMTCPYLGFFGWRIMTPDYPTLRVSKEAVAGVDVKENFTTFTAIDDNAVVPIVQYTTRRAGHQLMLVGDSITEGLGGAARDFGAIPIVCQRISSVDFPVEYYNTALHAQGAGTYSLQFRAYVEEVLPTVVFYQPYSVNDVPNGGMNASSYSAFYLAMARVFRDARALGRGAPIFLLEGTPTNKNFRDVGAGDQLRRDFNTWLASFTGATLVPGYAAAVTGLRDPDGQDLMKVGYTDDGVHPNNTGYNAMADAIEPFIINIMPDEAGLG